jgi:hypothetical protein
VQPHYVKYNAVQNNLYNLEGFTKMLNKIKRGFQSILPKFTIDCIKLIREKYRLIKNKWSTINAGKYLNDNILKFKSENDLDSIIKNIGKKNKIALVTMAKDEDYYLQEWIDYHLQLGFDDIFIFQNNWRFKSVVPNKNVHFLVWDEQSKPKLKGDQPLWEWNRQSICYSIFGRLFHKHYEWALFSDVDAFLTLKKHKNVSEFIANYDGIKQKQVMVNFAWFGDNGLNEFNKDYTSVVKRFTRRWDKPHNMSYYQFDPICKLHKNFLHELHYVPGEWIDLNGNVGYGFGKSNRKVSFDIAQINHYYTKTLPEWKLKMGKTRAEGDIYINNLDGFKSNNFNDVEDLSALNFFQDNH